MKTGLISPTTFHSSSSADRPKTAFRLIALMAAPMVVGSASRRISCAISVTQEGWHASLLCIHIVRRFPINGLMCSVRSSSRV
ncbi:hypothetical protein D3C72_2476040 [compost metagenome]